MKIGIIILSAGALLLSVYSVLSIELVDYKEVSSQVASSMFGGAICRCGGASDPDCKTNELPSGNIGVTTLAECNKIGKEIHPYDPGNKLHICQEGSGGGCVNGAGNGGCNSKRVLTIWSTSTSNCRYGGGLINGGLVSTHCKQL